MTAVRTYDQLAPQRLSATRRFDDHTGDTFAVLHEIDDSMAIA